MDLLYICREKYTRHRVYWRTWPLSESSDRNCHGQPSLKSLPCSLSYHKQRSVLVHFPGAYQPGSNNALNIHSSVRRFLFLQPVCLVLINFFVAPGPDCTWLEKMLTL